MEDAASDYLTALPDVSVVCGGQLEFYSYVTVKRVFGPCHRLLGLEHGDPVQFLGSVRSLLPHGDPNITLDILVEIGPESALQGPIKQIFQQNSETSAARVQYKASLVCNRNAIHTCHELLVLLVREGCPTNVNTVSFLAGSRSNNLFGNLQLYARIH